LRAEHSKTSPAVKPVRANEDDGARAEAAGVVLRARAPIMLTSRADNDRARLASCALALLYEYYRRQGHAFRGAPAAANAAA
jgi:hypothetical protein